MGSKLIKVTWFEQHKTSRQLKWKLETQCDYGLNKMSVLPFNQAVLLRSVWARNLMYDIILGQIKLENVRCVFPTPHQT